MDNPPCHAGRGVAHALVVLTLCASSTSCRSHEEPRPHLPSPGSSAGGHPAEVRLLPLGAPLPDVSAVAHNGESLRFPELKGKPVVVYFYPKDDTPGCTVEAQEIRDLWADIKAMGASVVGVSVDDTEAHKAFAEKHALPFLLLPDPEHRIAKAFGVPLKNGRAQRVSFVFGKTGALVKVFPQVTAKGHGSELVSALRDLEG